MTADRKGLTAKVLEAIGIASVILALIQGTFGGDMWGELYLFLGGIFVFFIGLQMEKQWAARNAATDERK